MEKVEKTVKYYMFSSFFFLLSSILIIGLIQYTSYESFFVEPEDNKNKSVNMLLESTNLESMKKACLFWAETNDSKNGQIDEALNLVYSLLNTMVFGAMILSVFFGYGFLSIYLKLKKIEASNSNAL